MKTGLIYLLLIFVIFIFVGAANAADGQIFNSEIQLTAEHSKTSTNTQIVTSNPKTTISVEDALDNKELSWTTDEGWRTINYNTHDGQDVLEAGMYYSWPGTKSYYLKTNVKGSGTIKFWWNQVANGGFGSIRFYDNDVEKEYRSNVLWEQISYNVASGNHELKWEFTNGPYSPYMPVYSAFCRIDQVEWIPAYDLKLNALYGPNTGLRGNKITIKDTVQNIGNQAVGSFYINYFLKANKSVSGKTYLGNRYVNGLTAGKSNTANSLLRIPASIIKGNYLIYAVADHTHRISENNENNNDLYSKSYIQVTDGKDLINLIIRSPNKGIRGKTLQVTNYVKNQGNIATGPANISYYLVPFKSMAKKYLLGYRTVTGLKPNTINKNISYFKINLNIPKGSYYIAAFADSGKKVTEINENNNILYADTKISII